MKLEVQNGIIRGLPLAFLLAFLVQGAAAVWWVSGKERDTAFLERRVGTLETGLARTSDGQTQVLERLIRIEERTNAQSVLLERIDKQIATLK
jgi:hypothetical protein